MTDEADPLQAQAAYSQAQKVADAAAAAADGSSSAPGQHVDVTVGDPPPPVAVDQQPAESASAGKSGDAFSFVNTVLADIGRGRTRP